MDRSSTSEFFEQFLRVQPGILFNLDSSDREYLREKQRSSAGCSAGRMPSYFAIGPLAMLSIWVHP